MRQEDHALLEPGMKVRIASRLMGAELYGADDPYYYKAWLGKEVTVRDVKQFSEWVVVIEECEDLEFFMEEIECIVCDDIDIVESEEPLSVLFERTM